jgi:8-oxo-dGTP diphosphatase
MSGGKPSISPGKEYVCGFLFDAIESGAVVLLTEKVRPIWQAGKLNGIGGAVEPGETIAEAMTREFHEETGVRFDRWRYFCKLRVVNKWTVHFFCGTSSLINDCKTKTDEALVKVTVQGDDLLYNTDLFVTDLRWLIPMAFGMDTEDCKYLEVIRVGG